MKFVAKTLVLAALAIGVNQIANADITIYAAASMTNAINDINKLYTEQYKTKVKTSYAASSTLAKQIEQGAGADIFISADTAWMDYLSKKKYNHRWYLQKYFRQPFGFNHTKIKTYYHTN
jgi:molybdate transport system substrate-binding protein